MNVVAANDIGRRPAAVDFDRQAIDGPLRDIDVMGSPVGHLAAAVLIPPAERVVGSLGNIRHVRGLSLPQVPVEVTGHRRGWKRSARGIRTGGTSDFSEPAKMPGTHHLGSQAKTMIASLPGSDLDNRIGRADFATQHLALVDGQRQRFLAVDIFSRTGRVNQHFGMPMIGRSNQNHIDIVAGQEIVIVLKDLRGAAETRSSLLADVPVDIR